MAFSAMPFRDNNIKTLLLDQRAPLHIPRSVRSNITKELLYYMGRILTFNPQKRIGVKELYELDWMTEKTGKAGTDDAGKAGSSQQD